MKKILAITAVLIIVLAPISGFSQPFPDSDAPCDGPFGGPCPIDGGVSFLIAAGLAFGGKKAYDISKKKP